MATLNNILLLIMFNSLLFAQQESKIKVNGGNKNTIEVNQKSKDTLQKSDIELSKTDSNKIKVNQEHAGKGETNEPTGFKSLIESTNNLFVALISIATFIGLFWNGFQYLKNKKKQ